MRLFSWVNYSLKLRTSRIFDRPTLRFKVKKLVSCLSTCIFPDNIKYPINETQLHNGPPHHSNNGYAYAKRMLEIHSTAYNEQYNDKFICVIPTNIYGKYDNFSIQNGHVIPALIHKCYKAKQMNKPFIVCGSGKPLRQFMYAKDFAEIIKLVIDNDITESFNVAPDYNYSIKKMAEIAINSINPLLKINFSNPELDGQYRKDVDTTIFKNNIKNFTFKSLSEGIKEIYELYKTR